VVWMVSLGRDKYNVDEDSSKDDAGGRNNRE